MPSIYFKDIELTRDRSEGYKHKAIAVVGGTEIPLIFIATQHVYSNGNGGLETLENIVGKDPNYTIRQFAIRAIITEGSTDTRIAIKRALEAELINSKDNFK